MVSHRKVLKSSFLKTISAEHKYDTDASLAKTAQRTKTWVTERAL